MSQDDDIKHNNRATGVVLAAEGYEALALVLQRAFQQAAHGKGKERHARGEPFEQQVMADGARRFGVGGLLFQAFKKSEESQRLPHDKAVTELLGAINYLAGAVIELDRQHQENLPATGPGDYWTEPPTASNDNRPCCNGGHQAHGRCQGCAEAHRHA